MRVCYWSSILLMNRPRHFGKCHLERRRSFLLVSSPRVLFLALCPQLQLVALALSNIHPSTNLRHLPRRSRVVYIPAQSAVIGYAYTLLNPLTPNRARRSAAIWRPPHFSKSHWLTSAAVRALQIQECFRDRSLAHTCPRLIHRVRQSPRHRRTSSRFPTANALPS